MIFTHDKQELFKSTGKFMVFTFTYFGRISIYQVVEYLFAEK